MAGERCLADGEQTKVDSGLNFGEETAGAVPASEPGSLAGAGRLASPCWKGQMGRPLELW